MHYTILICFCLAELTRLRAYGVFECTDDCTDITSASFLNTIGKNTDVLLRVSTVGPESGSADTVRDVHGWAMKLYTDQGNQDWVFNNTVSCSPDLYLAMKRSHIVIVYSLQPTFFVRDPIKFPSMNRSHKRHPRTHRPDPNMVSHLNRKYLILYWQMTVLGVRTPVPSIDMF